MYMMDADGAIFHDPSQNDPTLAAMGTEATLELNKAGTLVFTLPPGNVAYHALKKRKSVVTLYQDGEMLFRGRVLETVTDLYNMKEVYCEGELTLLMDSVQEPVEYKGSAASYLQQMISNHNAQMDADKQFVLGDVSALSDEDTVDIETTEYRETLGEIRGFLVDEFGGYLRVRYSGGTRYLDYIKEYTDSSAQSIKFGVNLVDIENRLDTFKFCTVLLPLGKTVKGQKTTIAEVNGGSVYYEDAAAVAVYGRIIKTETFDNVEDPAELLDFAQRFMAQMKEARGLTVKAVDLKNIDPDADGIRLGDRVMLDSSPHGLDESEICSKVVLPIDTPEQAEYTFGTPPETLTDSNAKVAQKVSQNGVELSKLRDWLTVTDEELKLQKQWISESGDIISNVLFEMDAMNATIKLKADQTVVDGLDTRISNAEILIDGANAAIDLKADRTEVTSLEFRLSEAEILIDGANAAIELKANQTAVDALTERISQAEIDIDGAKAAISLKAEQSLVQTMGSLLVDTLEDVDSLRYSQEALVERISQAEIGIDGANAQISLKANQSTVSAMEQRLSQAEIDIDGANAAIDLKAEQRYVQALGELLVDTIENVDGLKDQQETVVNRVSRAEILIDAALGAISLTAEDVNELGNRVTSAELLIDGQNSIIAAKADLILLDGYVKATDLETETLKVIEGATLASLKTGSFNCSGIGTINTLYATGAVIGSLVVNGGTAATQEWVEGKGYLTSVPSRYATQSWVIERGYAISADVAATLTNFVMKAELTQKSQFVVTSVNKTVNSAGYVTNVTYSGTTITYYA